MLPSSRPITWRFILVAILAVALALRLFYLNQIAAMPFFNQPVGDSVVYLKRAAEIGSGALLPAHPFFYGSIFYPYFLATVLTFSHGSLFWVYLTQALAGVALVALLAHLARRLSGDLAGLAAGVLAAFYGPLAFLEADVLGVVWGLLGLAAGLFACVRWADERARVPGAGVAWLGLAGTAFGLAATERPNLVALVPLIALWCAIVAGGPHGPGRAFRPRALWAPVAFLGGAILPLAVVVALDVAGTGQWVPLTTSSGINLSIGYHPGATGTYEEPWEKQASQFAARHTELEEASIARASLEAGRALSPQQASAFWTRRALAFIRSHPMLATRQTLRKAALMLNNAEIPNHLDYDFMRIQASALELMPVGFGVVLALATLGLGFSLLWRRRRAEAMLLLIVATGATLSMLPFFVADRYRIALVPPLIVAAGVGVAALHNLAREARARGDRRIFVVLGAALMAALFAGPQLTRPRMGRDYWMFAQAYQARGNLPAAAAAYKAAVNIEGNDGELLNNLAVVYRSLGENDKAIEVLERAVKAAPDLAFPHKNLGMLMIGKGDMDGALAELREAARLEPNDAETLGAVGGLLAERGDYAGAAEAFGKARRLAPKDRRLAGLTRHYAAVQGLRSTERQPAR